MRVKPVPPARRLGVLLLGALVGAGGVGASCSGGDRQGTTTSPPPNPPPPRTPDARIVLVTDVTGHLEPCGCTSRPLGGLDRMVAAVAELGADRVPMALLSTGDLWYGFDEGHGAAPVAADDPVVDWRADTLAQAFSAAGLRAAAPGPRDRALSPERRNTLAGDVAVLGPEEAASAVRLTLGPLTVGVIGVPASADDPVASARTALEGIAPKPDRVVALVPGGRRAAARVARELDGVDLVVVGGLEQAKPSPPARYGDAYVLNAGRQGQGLVVVDLYAADGGPEALVDASPWTLSTERARLDQTISRLEARGGEAAGGLVARQLAEARARRTELDGDPTAPGPGAFVARWDELAPEVRGDSETDALLDRLAKRINDHNRLAYADVTPPAPSPGEAAYVGSRRCAACHAPAVAWWEATPHGRAYRTLVDADKQFHLECVGCHVTGYGRAGGATVTHLGEGNALRHVGCESCHGPGSAHVAAPAEASLPAATPESVCVGCHNEEHSDLFVYEGYRAMLRAPGHGLPVADDAEAAR